MRLALISAMLVGTARAQTVIDESRFAGVTHYFERLSGEGALACEVTAFRPMLNFSFRFQAGYVARVPLGQFAGEGHRWAVLVEVTPQGGNRRPVYLGSSFVLPKIPETRAAVSVVGSYLLGEGRYKVRWVMYDERQRACHKEWTVDVRRSSTERHVVPGMPPDTVSGIARHPPLPGPPSTGDTPPLRLTLLLDATPLSPRRTHLGARDRMLLVGWVASLLERLPATSVRLVAFSLDQQREIFRKDGFAPEDLDLVGEALNRLELDTVDYHVLQNPRGYLDLLANLVNQERDSAPQSNAVVFLGPRCRYERRVPGSVLDRPAAATARFFYLQFRPYPLMEAAVPDSIQQTVAAAKGKTILVRTPADFAKAIAQVERTAR